MTQALTIAKTPPAPPCTVVILGASGDLARRKLLPSLYNLEACGQGLLPARSAIVGFARSRLTTADFRKTARTAVDEFSRLKVEAKCWKTFEERLEYLSGLDHPDGFAALRKHLEENERARGLPPNRVYYLAVPPQAIQPAVEQLHAAGLIARRGATNFTRVVVEKPIGTDLKSALEISRTLHRFFDESQIFRIDHYLGKETVQNVMVLRFANSIFEQIWNNRNVDHVQITVAEQEGVGARAAYYDPAGALRDMMQNHMLQLLSLTAMEPPVSLEAGAIREAKLDVLRALRPFGRETLRQQVVRARYGPGTINGRQVVGYRGEPGVPEDSHAETFVALKVYVDNWRWSGVPFYLRTGKRLERRASAIFVQFRDVPQILFNRQNELPPDVLAIRIQPDEGFSFEVQAKRPGLDLAVSPVRMNLSYQSEFPGPSPDAYERLLLDVMAGDHTLFISGAFVEKSWEFIQNILDQWSKDDGFPLEEYPAGTWGPEMAGALIHADRRSWRAP